MHKHTNKDRFKKFQWNKITFSNSLPKCSFPNLLSYSDIFQVKILTLQEPKCTYILQTVNFTKKIWSLAFKKCSSATVRKNQIVGDSHHIKFCLLPKSNSEFKMVFGDTIISVRHLILTEIGTQIAYISGGL